jgi:hypothetical protein
MSDIPRRLKQLEKQLASLDGDEAMLLSELDGFLAGILGLSRADHARRMTTDGMGPWEQGRGARPRKHQASGAIGWVNYGALQRHRNRASAQGRAL